MRKDLSPSQQAVQSAHAILEASRQGLLSHTSPHPHLILCGQEDESQLLSQAGRLAQRGIRFILFREPDIDNQVTALATEPLRDDQRRQMRDLKLLRL